MASLTELESAFVLHTRPYTDSRRLVELFTRHHGRIGSVARSQNKTARFSLLRPFQPLLVSWQGRGELKTLTHYESVAPSLPLVGHALYCGFYLNELLIRLLAVADPHEMLFDAYSVVLAELASADGLEGLLRDFELDVLRELGYGIAFDRDARSGDPIDPDAHYQFFPQEGFSRSSSSVAQGRVPLFGGASILAVGQRDFTDLATRQAAKIICREALQPLLGGKPLKSRAFFSP